MTGVLAPAPRTGAATAPRPARPVVAAILPRGEAIRNFSQTGVLDHVQGEADLTVVTVVPDAGVLAELEARHPRVLPLTWRAEPYPVRLLRELLDMAHGRALWTAAARERWRLRDVEATTPVARLKRAGRKALVRPFATPAGVRRLERLERRVSRWLSPRTEWTRTWGAVRPDVVFNGSHVHSAVAVQAIQAAQWLGIPTAAFVFSWDNLTSQGRVMPPHDHYFVWNEEIRAQLLALYPDVAPGRVTVTGTPQFDLHFRPEHHWSRERFCAEVGADPARPLVLYSTGMPNHMPGEPRLVELVADQLAAMPELGRPQLLVRVYPKDRTGRFDALRARRPDILFPPAAWVSQWLTPTEADNRLYTNTLRHVAAGVNVASTVSLELCMFDVPVVNIGFDPPGEPDVRVPYARYYEFDHYAPVVASRAVTLARDPGALAAALRRALADPAADRAARAAFMRRMFADTLDGRSGARVAEALLRIARHEAP